MPPKLHFKHNSVADSGPGFRAAAAPAWPKDTFTSWAGIYFCQFQTLLAVVHSLIKIFIAVIQLLMSCLGAWQRSLSINMLE
jgi:hypothetical protein